MASHINCSPKSVQPVLLSFCSVIWSFPKLFSSELHFAAIYEEFCIASIWNLGFMYSFYHGAAAN